MNPAISQHPHYATVPVAISGFVARGGDNHHMHAVDPTGVNYAPMHHIGTPVNMQAHPIHVKALKYRVVVLGAGPVGITFLLKLLEEIHQKSKTHRIDCKLLVIEQRDNFRYPADRAAPTTIGGLRATRKDVWEDANTAIWPQCFKFKRFRNVKGEWKTLQDALQSEVDYTILRADLLTALGQMSHAVFGNHDSFHFIPNSRIDQSTLANLEGSIQACIAANKIQDFPLSRGTLIVLSSGWRQQGNGHLIPGNVWTPLSTVHVALSMNLKIKAAPKSLGPAQDPISNFRFVASRLEGITDNGDSEARVFADNQNAAVTMHVEEAALMQAILALGKSDIQFRELPSQLATLFLRQISIEMFDDGLELAVGDHEDIGSHVLKVQTDKGKGFWSKAHTRTRNESLVVLLGSARIAYSAHLIPHLTSASVLGEIAGHSEANLRTSLDKTLVDFETYSALSVQHLLQDFAPIKSAANDLEDEIGALFLSKLVSVRQFLRQQVDTLGAGDTKYMLRVPTVINWAKSVEIAIHETIKTLLENAKTREDLWLLAYRSDYSHLSKKCGVSSQELQQWATKSRENLNKEDIRSQQEDKAQNKYKKQMLVMASKISQDLVQLTFQELQIENSSRKM